MASKVVSIDDLKMRFRHRKTEASKARVHNMAQEAITYLDNAKREAERRSEEDRILGILKNCLLIEMSKAYACLSPERAENLINLAHTRVRLERGVT